MKKAKFNQIKHKYLALGVTESNLDYAISAVNEGTKREYIIESLTASYRGMTESESTNLLKELFEANGGEFKKENRGGYLYGILLCAVGLLGLGFSIAIFLVGSEENVKIKFLLIAIAAAVFGLVKGPALIIKAFRGNYRDTDEPV